MATFQEEFFSKMKLDLDVINTNVLQSKFYISIFYFLTSRGLSDPLKKFSFELTSENTAIEQKRKLLGESDEWKQTQILTYLSKDFDNPFFKLINNFYELSLKDISEREDIIPLLEDVVIFMDDNDEMEQALLNLIQLVAELKKYPQSNIHSYSTRKMIKEIKNVYSIFIKYFDDTILGIPKTKDLSIKKIEKKMIAISIKISEDYIKRFAFKWLYECYQEQNKISVIESVTIKEAISSEEKDKILMRTVWTMRFLFDKLKIKENIEGKAKLVDFLLDDILTEYNSLSDSNIYTYFHQDIALSGKEGLTTLSEIGNAFKAIDDGLFKEINTMKVELTQNIKNNVPLENLIFDKSKIVTIEPIKNTTKQKKIKTIRQKVIIIRYIFNLIGKDWQVEKSEKMRFINFLCNQYTIEKFGNGNQIKEHYENPPNEEDKVIINSLFKSIDNKWLIRQ